MLHHCKLPSTRTHWSTSKDVPLSLEQTPSEPLRRVRAGTKPCVTKRCDAGCVRAMRPACVTANPSRELGVVQTLVHSFEFDYAFGIIKLFFLCCITEKYTSNTSEFATARTRQGQRTILNRKAVPAGHPGENRKNRFNSIQAYAIARPKESFRFSLVKTTLLLYNKMLKRNTQNDAGYGGL